MSSFLVKLGLATEDAPTASTTPAKPITPTDLKTVGTTNPPVILTTGTGMVDTAKESEIIEKLKQSLTDGKMVGVSYLDFAILLANMEKVLAGADERTKFMASFAALSSQGVAPEVIVNTAKHYLDILVSEETSFSNMMIDRVKNEVQSKIDEQTQIDKDIEAANKQIQELSASIMDKNIKKIELGNAAAQARSSLETYANTFQSAKNHIVDQIQGTVQKFNGYVASPKA
jgi:hypothetical protein